MKTAREVYFTVLVAVLLALATTSVTVGGTIKPQSTAQQSANWWQWQETYYGTFEFDGDCSLGQLGQIWYLLGSNSPDPVARACEAPVPAGKRMFFPLVNAVFYNAPGETYSIEEKRIELDMLFGDTDAFPLYACDLAAMLDGSPVVYEGTPIERVQSPPFEYAGDPEAVSDGYWVMLPKLPLGEHTVAFTGGFCFQGETEPVFSVDVFYTLTIVE